MSRVAFFAFITGGGDHEARFSKGYFIDLVKLINVGKAFEGNNCVMIAGTLRARVRQRSRRERRAGCLRCLLIASWQRTLLKSTLFVAVLNTLGNPRGTS